MSDNIKLIAGHSYLYLMESGEIGQTSIYQESKTCFNVFEPNLFKGVWMLKEQVLKRFNIIEDITKQEEQEMAEQPKLKKYFWQ